MNPKEWQAARKLVHGTMHVSVATIGPDGRPHQTPIGSLMLHPTEPRGYWLEKFTTVMPGNLEKNDRIEILAVNSGLWFWLKSLWKGSFTGAPALRLAGTAGPLRPAKDSERIRFLKKVKFAQSLKGHKILWSDMAMARDVIFDEIIPVRIGRMWPPKE